MLTVQSNSPTMTSREIADLVESRHDSVKRTIERLIHSEVIAHPPMVDGEKAANGVTERMYLINKRDSYVIVAQLSPEFTARLVDRWQELEGETPRLPQTMAQALRLAADQAEVIEQQQAMLAAAAPAVDFVERYVDSTGLKGFRQVAKLLGVKENEFRDFLIEEKIVYRLAGEMTPHAAHIDAGRFFVKAGTSEKTGHAFNSAKFTPKGVTWVAGELAKWQLSRREQLENADA